MTTVPVRAHERRLPDRKEDPLASVIEARRQSFARKWNLELVGSNDDRLADPMPDPVPGGPSLASIRERLYAIADLMKKIGRA